jgi:hypothetical protein
VFHRCCLQVVVFYSVLFVVPTLLTLLYTGGRTQLSREDLEKTETYKQRHVLTGADEERVRDMKAQMNKVLFETKGTLGDRQAWAVKRDQRRAEQEQQRRLEQQQRQQQQAKGP